MEERDKELQDILAKAERTIRLREAKAVEVCGRRYEVKQITNAVRGKIDELNQMVYRQEQRMKEAITVSEARRISRSMYSLHAKQAACYLLGERIWLVRSAFLLMLFPYLDRVTGLRYWLKWHKLNHLPSEVMFRINEAGMHDEDMDFSLANWQITKAQLALSTRLIGEGMEEYRKRMESAKKQASEDGTATRADGRSEVSSPKAETTKR